MQGFENLEFPVLYTFKIVVDNKQEFILNTKTLFVEKKDAEFSEKPSKTGKYVSVTATMQISDINELKYYYEKISGLEGLKYHL